MQNMDLFVDGYRHIWCEGINKFSSITVSKAQVLDGIGCHQKYTSPEQKKSTQYTIYTKEVYMYLWYSLILKNLQE